MMKYWYAVEKNREDTDWGTGSYDIKEAIRIAENYGDEAMIAVIDESGKEPMCVAEIFAEDFDEYLSPEMYLTETNGGTILLFTDGRGSWYCDHCDPDGKYGEVNVYPEIDGKTGETEDLETVARKIRAAVNAGDVYDAKEWIAENSDFAEKIADYDGLTIDQIDALVNNKAGYPVQKSIKI